MKRVRRSQSPPRAAATAMSLVLGDDDLLREILLRLGLPTSLLRAALVCRRWYRNVSDRSLLSRFRDRHPPRVLGVYLHFSVASRPRFFPVLPLPELAAAARRAGSFVDALPGSVFISDSLGGRLLVNTSEEHYGQIDSTLLLCNPLSPAAGDTVVVPPPPPPPPLQLTGGRGPVLYNYGQFLPVNGDGSSYSCVMVGYNGLQITARLYELQQDMSWVLRASAAGQLPGVTPQLPGLMPPSRLRVMLLDDAKVYILSTSNKILVCDFPSSSIAAVDLPNGVENDFLRRSIKLSRGRGGAGSGIFLVHVKGPLLRVFHGSGAGTNWSLVKSVCLRKVCADLGIAASCWTSAAAERHDAGVTVHAAGDSAGFVILKMFGTIVFLDLESTKAEKVYEVKPEDKEVLSVRPFMMMWPSLVFPLLEDG